MNLRLREPVRVRIERVVLNTADDRGEDMAGRPADEVLAALDAAVRQAGATPNGTALREHAAQIEAGENPFGQA